MDTVSFTRMRDGTAEDYKLLEALEEEFAKGLPERIEATLKNLENSFSGYKVTRLEHSLQSATRAHRDGCSVDYIVAALLQHYCSIIAALLHGIGDELAPYSHSEMAASIFRPYVSDKLYWIIKTTVFFRCITTAIK